MDENLRNLVRGGIDKMFVCYIIWNYLFIGLNNGFERLFIFFYFVMILG